MPDEGWRGYLDALAGIVPLNARVFARNVFRDEDDVGSLISAEDFSEEEIEEIYRRIDLQNKINALDEQRYRELIPAYEKHLSEYPKTPQGIESIRRGIDSTLETMPDGQFVETSESAIMDDHYAAVAGHGPISDEERYEMNLDRFNKNTQSRLDDAKRALESYERTRGKTSVPHDREAAGSVGNWRSGPRLGETIVKSLNSPGYRINTTLGSFNAYKNEDGLTTIRDLYNWSKIPESVEIGSTKLWLDALPQMLSRPESFGNVLMRTLLKEKYSPVEFTLPPRV